MTDLSESKRRCQQLADDPMFERAVTGSFIADLRAVLAAVPEWRDKPTCEGLWLTTRCNTPVCAFIHESRFSDGTCFGGIWYGPIP